MHASLRACLLLGVSVLAACGDSRPRPTVAGGDAERGHAALQRHGCASCHTIPGMDSYGANVGPPLTAMAARAYLGGVLPNTPYNMVRWLRDPPAVDPLTTMPKLGLTQSEAVDIVAFLYAAD